MALNDTQWQTVALIVVPILLALCGAVLRMEYRLTRLETKLEVYWQLVLRLEHRIDVATRSR